MRHALVCLSVMLLSALPAWGQLVARGTYPATQPANEPKVVRMTVYPAAQPEPSLKYLLLPPMHERQKGNAALLYYMAMQMMTDAGRQTEDKINQWVSTPLPELPSAEAAQALREYTSGRFRLLEDAALRDQCDWDLPLNEGMAMPMVSLAKLRQLARALALEARLEIRNGKPADALRTLRTGFAMARHLGNGKAMLIGNLVGIAIGSLMDGVLVELIQSPASPNLYWCLAQLPRPMFDMRDAMEYERVWMYYQFPALKGVQSGSLTASEARRLMEEGIGTFAAATGADPSDYRQRLIATALAIKAYPEGKQYLLSKGLSPKEVQGMSVQQVVLRYYLGEYEQARDEMFKWYALPYWQGVKGLTRAETSLSRTPGKFNPFAMLLPSLSRARLIATRADRQIAALMCIEGVRMYVAAHKGALPKSLDDLDEDSPAPLNPVTGKAFGYSVDGRTFTLEAADPETRGAERYIVTVETK